MTENTSNPVVAVAPNTSGLSEEKQKRYLATIRSLAISEVVIGILVGLLGIGAAFYSIILSGICNFYYDYRCTYHHYPSFGVGLWSSVVTVVAGVLGICSTGINLVRKCRIITHVVVAIMALLSELITGCGAAVIGGKRTYTYGDDYVYLGMMIAIAVTSFIKLFLLAMSIRQGFLLLPNCDCDCAEEMNPPNNVMYVQTSGGQHQGGVVMVQPGVYNYPQTGVMMQPQGTMVMTPQGAMMMQPGMMQPGMMAPQTTTVPPPEMAVTAGATAPPSEAPSGPPTYQTQQPHAYYPVQPTYTAQVEEKKPIGS